MNKPWILFLIVAAFLIAVVIVFRNSVNPVIAIIQAGDTEISTSDSLYVHWWNQASKCVGIDAAYDKKLRYFVGKTIPKGWTSANEGNEKSKYIIVGSTDSEHHFILLAPGYEKDSTLIVHEQLHDYLKVGGHPQKYYGDSIATHCGIAPGHD